MKTKLIKLEKEYIQNGLVISKLKRRQKQILKEAGEFQKLEK